MELSFNIRLHSSGMRTTSLLTVSQHALDGGVYLLGVYLPSGGCTCPGGVPAGGGCSCGGYLGVYLPARGCTCLGSVPAWGCTCQGVYLPGRCTCWGVSQHAMGQAPPPPNRITDTCKNITFPQLLLRAVMTA